jgi:hypothetical protein
MAKSAAKNISSLESQTIVPTATALGRVILWCAAWLDIGPIIPEKLLAVCLEPARMGLILPIKR